MEGNRTSTLGVPLQECPILCITKSIVFVIISVFILYLPLGDPTEHCSNTSLSRENGTVCCLCDIHNFLLKVARRTTDAVEILVCFVLDALYEAKLKFYSFLERVDRKDLCRSVCCTVDSEIEPKPSRERRFRPCRCPKSRCQRND